jgi:DNA-binding transcriptional ArsR family regulator
MEMYFTMIRNSFSEKKILDIGKVCQYDSCMRMQIKKDVRTENDPSSCCGIPGMPNPMFFRVLSDPSRLRIIAYLAECGTFRTVSQIAENVPVDLSVVSRHLTALKEERIVLSERRGREVYYRLDHTYLSRMFLSMANAIEQCCPP